MLYLDDDDADDDVAAAENTIREIPVITVTGRIIFLIFLQNCRTHKFLREILD
jgi:hypothetical protein